MAENKKVDVIKFYKENIINSKKYANRKSILKVLLLEDTQYSLEEVEEILNKFMAREVK